MASSACQKALLQGFPAAAAAGIKFNPSFPAACTSEMTPLTKDSPTLFGSPENHFMVFWERGNSGGSEHPGWPGCKRSAACDDDIEGCLSCSLARKSGKATFSTVLASFFMSPVQIPRPGLGRAASRPARAPAGSRGAPPLVWHPGRRSWPPAWTAERGSG